ncbi:MAG: hypothetical protein H6621_00515 [Halobacteriovoraceae bacterium]|nr:hypothetical protein [Halobacteriovoraceae bacterium]
MKKAWQILIFMLFISATYAEDYTASCQLSISKEGRLLVDAEISNIHPLNEESLEGTNKRMGTFDRRFLVEDVTNAEGDMVKYYYDVGGFVGYKNKKLTVADFLVYRIPYNSFIPAAGIAKEEYIKISNKEGKRKITRFHNNQKYQYTLKCQN